MTRVDERTQLLDTVPDGPLDEHARMVRSLLGCDAAMVTVLDEDAQRFLGMTGLRGEARAERSTPLDQSLCREVAARDEPLQLWDLVNDPVWGGHPAIDELGVGAYVGVPLRTASGAVVGAVCGLHGSPRPWSGEDLANLGLVRDLVESEIVRLLASSRERVRSEEITLLLSTLRHELGGQLAVVLGGIETALLPAIDEELRGRVLRNARRDTRAIVSTLDALLRADSRAPVQLRDVDVAHLVADVAREVGEAHETDRISADVEPCRVTTEATLLHHVIRNLVDNACKYSSGPVAITGRPAGSAVQIDVIDHGSGLPRGVVDQLYQPFRRQHDDGGRTGFGLGLYIIRTLCQRLGAGLAVDSDQEGTRITVTVPDRQSPKPSKAASSSDGA